jgi:hypothetical protein
MEISRRSLKEDYLLKAKELISEYYYTEFEDEEGVADDCDLKNVSLAYTTIDDNEDKEHEIQVDADLENFAINQYIDNKLFKTWKYDSLEDLVEMELTDLIFDTLIEVNYIELEEFLKDK